MLLVIVADISSVYLTNREFELQTWSSRRKFSSKQYENMLRYGRDGKPNFLNWFWDYVRIYNFL
jgi:hypothetical protein